ncbi:MAG: hypothetical protein QOC79_763 [Actinomycetota bacterium]|nr:hypothetical protein [Actinomycetota bacterium]
MKGRQIATIGLVGIACLLTLVSAIALWMRSLVLNTDAYVRAVGPVLDRPEVRDALAETIVSTLYNHVDVTTRLRGALPKSAAEFAPTLAASIRATSVQVAAAALATPAASRAWRDANRVAHDQLVRVLEGKGEIGTTTNGEVAIDTGALATAVRHALDSRGIRVFDRVPVAALEERFVLFRSTDLMRAQQATRFLDKLATWLPLATIAAGAGAIASSTRRRRTVAHLAVGVAAVMVMISVGAAVGRAYYLARVGAAHRVIAGAPFDALVGPLRAGARLTFAVALATFVVVWLSESRALVARERRARVLVVELMQRNARPLAIAGAAIAAVVLVAWDRPRPLVVFSTVAAFVLWELVCLAAGRVGPQGGTGGPTAAN